MMTDSSPPASALALFAGEGLPFPPLPPAMAAALTEIDAHVFATRHFDASPYNLEIFRQEIMGPDPVDDYALIGFAGRGINSWAAHQFLVTAGLALFIQLPWGGAYTDADAARRDIAAAFEWSAALQARVRQAVASGHIPKGWRLLVVASSFARPGYGWVPAGSKGRADVEWIATGNVWQEAEQALTDVMSGAKPLLPHVPPALKD